MDDQHRIFKMLDDWVRSRYVWLYFRHFWEKSEGKVRDQLDEFADAKTILWSYQLEQCICNCAGWWQDNIFQWDFSKPSDGPIARVCLASEYFGTFWGRILRLDLAQETTRLSPTVQNPKQLRPKISRQRRPWGHRSPHTPALAAHHAQDPQQTTEPRNERPWWKWDHLTGTIAHPHYSRSRAREWDEADLWGAAYHLPKLPAKCVKRDVAQHRTYLWRSGTLNAHLRTFLLPSVFPFAPARHGRKEALERFGCWRCVENDSWHLERGRRHDQQEKHDGGRVWQLSGPDQPPDRVDWQHAVDAILSQPDPVPGAVDAPDERGADLAAGA